MDKLAQERSILNKLREKANLTGKILENINPEFQELMERLRGTDERIRTHASQLKDFVKSSKSLVNRRDYLSAAVSLSAFHERCRYISAELDRFIKSVDLKHYKFLLEQFDEEQREQLFGYDPTKQISFEDAQSADDFIQPIDKHAAPADFWFKITDPLSDLAQNLTTGRSQAMKALEKRFSIAFLKELKVSSITMVDRTENFFSFIISIFKKLATALATRHVDQYVEVAKNFIKKFADYHKQFVAYYQKNIVPLKEQHEKMLEAARLVEEEKAKKLEEEAAKNREEEARRKQFEQSGTQEKLQEMLSPTDANIPGKKTTDEEDPFSLTTQKAAFLTNLNKIAQGNNQNLLVMEILKYSEKLEDTDPVSSMKLLAIAEGIVEDYKTAGVFDFFKGKKEEPAGPESKEREKEVPLQ